jgi:hypothetical protein
LKTLIGQEEGQDLDHYKNLGSDLIKVIILLLASTARPSIAGGLHKLSFLVVFMLIYGEHFAHFNYQLLLVLHILGEYKSIYLMICLRPNTPRLNTSIHYGTSCFGANILGITKIRDSSSHLISKAQTERHSQFPHYPRTPPFSFAL